MKNKLLIILILILAALTACTTNEEQSSVLIEEGVEKNKNNQEQHQLNENDEIQKNFNNENKDDSNVAQENEKSTNNIENNSKINIEENNNQLVTEETTKTTETSRSNNLNNNNSNNDGIKDIIGEEKQEFNILKIKGLVNNELDLSLDELKSMESIIYEADFYSLNSYGTKGYTHFKGVKLWDLLASRAEIKNEAVKVTVISQDGYKMEFTVEQVQKQDYIDETNPDTKYPMIIAWEENGEEYDPNEGATYKLVVGQKEAGDVNKPQWVSNIDYINVE